MHFPPHIVLICVYLIFCRGEETKGKCQVIWGHEWWLYVERRSRSRKGIKSFLPFESRPLLPLFVVCCKQYHLDGRSVIIYTFLCGNINGHINYLGRPEPSPLHSTNALLPQSSPDSPVHSFPGLYSVRFVGGWTTTTTTTTTTRPARTDVPSMYAEDDAFEEEFTRSADIRQSRASLTRGSRYYTEGFVQYSQPSLNGSYQPARFISRCSLLCCCCLTKCKAGW